MVTVPRTRGLVTERIAGLSLSLRRGRFKQHPDYGRGLTGGARRCLLPESGAIPDMPMHIFQAKPQPSHLPRLPRSSWARFVVPKTVSLSHCRTYLVTPRFPRRSHPAARPCSAAASPPSHLIRHYSFGHGACGLRPLVRRMSVVAHEAAALLLLPTCHFLRITLVVQHGNSLGDTLWELVLDACVT